MYKCLTCGNVQYFTELRNIATKVICTEEGVPMPILCQDILLSVVEVYCELCHASTEDDLIIGDDGVAIDLTNQDPPDIGYSG